jgi:peptidoglycan/LPS O-acetylase OafA/YrhL
MLLFAAGVLAELYVAPPSTFWGSLFAVLAAGLALHPSRLIVNAFTRYLGDISYSGYLVHFAVLDIGERVLRHFLAAVTRHPLPHLALLYTGVVLGSVVAATVGQRLVEQPARRAGRLLIARLERRHRTPVAEPA